MPVNIFNNREYERLEFVLLDYNSQDDLENFVKQALNDHIESGRLVYYKTLTPKWFNRSHSRNLAFKLAQGDIVCNIDADNYTGRGFADYVSIAFKNKDSFLTTLGTTYKLNQGDVFGRTCTRKEDFTKIGGYDERMTHYGFEDYDFANRLEMNGLKRQLIEGDDFLKAIPHDNQTRISNESVAGNLLALLVSYLDSSSTEFLFLFKNKEFKRATVLDNKSFDYSGQMTELLKSQLNYDFSILEDNWIEGTWKEESGQIELMAKEDQSGYLYPDQMDNRFILNTGNMKLTFHEVKDRQLLEDAILFYSEVTNRIIMSMNLLENKYLVNNEPFGCDVVYKNFDYETPVSI